MKMASLKIRRYESRDFGRVMDLHAHVMKYAGVYKGDGPWDADLQDIENVYFNDNGVFLVGEFSGRIVVMGAFQKSENGLAEVKRMRVESALQGKGYGRLLLRTLEKMAKKFGYRGFHLETSVLQITAQKFYIKNGFKEVGRMVIEGFDCILFEKIF